MAISLTEFRLLAVAHSRGLFGQGGSVLEFGEANVHEIDVADVLGRFLSPGPDRDEAIATAQRLAAGTGNEYELVKVIYRALFKYTSYTAIDLDPGGPHRIQQDLNLPFDLGIRYDTVINNGTTEHVFNQANAYKAIHDHTKVGGLMIHWTPAFGWPDHGLFNAQPGMFFDLARANDYEVRLAALMTNANIYEFGAGTIWFETLAKRPDLTHALSGVILRKTVDAPFKFPIQGDYRNLEAFRGHTN